MACHPAQCLLSAVYTHHLKRPFALQVEISKTYGMQEWRDDLRKVLKMAGEANKKVLALVVDRQIANMPCCDQLASQHHHAVSQQPVHSPHQRRWHLSCCPWCVQVAFLFSDTQIKDESFVEDLSNLINTCEVPNLLGSGELAGIFENIRARAKQAGMDGSKDQLYNFFIQEVRADCCSHCHLLPPSQCSASAKLEACGSHAD